MRAAPDFHLYGLCFAKAGAKAGNGGVLMLGIMRKGMLGIGFAVVLIAGLTPGMAMAYDDHDVRVEGCFAHCAGSAINQVAEITCEICCCSAFTAQLPDDAIAFEAEGSSGSVSSDDTSNDDSTSDATASIPAVPDASNSDSGQSGLPATNSRHCCNDSHSSSDGNGGCCRR